MTFGLMVFVIAVVSILFGNRISEIVKVKGSLMYLLSLGGILMGALASYRWFYPDPVTLVAFDSVEHYRAFHIAGFPVLLCSALILSALIYLNVSNKNSNG